MPERTWGTIPVGNIMARDFAVLGPEATVADARAVVAYGQVAIAMRPDVERVCVAWPGGGIDLTGEDEGRRFGELATSPMFVTVPRMPIGEIATFATDLPVLGPVIVEQNGSMTGVTTAISARSLVAMPEGITSFETVRTALTDHAGELLYDTVLYNSIFRGPGASFAFDNSAAIADLWGDTTTQNVIQYRCPLEPAKIYYPGQVGIDGAGNPYCLTHNIPVRVELISVK
ncbi:MAG TPA: hypothetical protein VH482_14270 [Thermomicrobiales bacterium]|jgi:hypothetical protein